MNVSFSIFALGNRPTLVAISRNQQFSRSMRSRFLLTADRAGRRNAEKDVGCDAKRVHDKFSMCASWFVPVNQFLRLPDLDSAVYVYCYEMLNGLIVNE